MKDEKFELTEETIEWDDHTLYRIKALKDFGNIKKGDLGGFIEKEDNLSQDGTCWIYDDAKVYDDARVFEDAKVYNNANVFDCAVVYCNAEISSSAKVYGDAEVCGNTQVYGNAFVYGKAFVYGNAKIYDDAFVNSDADIQGNAEIKSINDYAVFKNFWSSGCWFTWTRSNDMWSVDDFYGTGEELVKEAYEDSEKSGKCYEAYVNLMKELNSI